MVMKREPLKYIPCDDDMDPPIPKGKCGAIGSAWGGLAEGELCSDSAVGEWYGIGLPLCFRHLREKENLPPVPEVPDESDH